MNEGENISKNKAKGMNKLFRPFARTVAYMASFLKHYVPHFLHQTKLTTRPAVEAFGNIRRYRHTDYGLIISSAAVGIIIGVFIVIFHNTMEYAEVLFKKLDINVSSDIPIQHLLFIFIPALGGLGIGLLQKTWFRGATVQSLHTVVNALVNREGKINPVNSLKSIIYAALSLSSGGGAGREGPTIALGASLGSSFAQLTRLRPQQLRVLCGAGAAAAISGIFNAPLGAIVFALEGMIGETSIRTFVPLVISSVLATATTRLFMGNTPLLIAPALANVSLADYFLLALAGVLSGYVAIYFLKTYNGTINFTEKKLLKVPEVWRPALGGLAAGIMLLMLPTMWETTYSPINNVIAGEGMPITRNSIFEYLLPFFNQENIIFLFMMVAAATVLVKPISNAVTLGSGGAGGTMAPVIKVGAMFGFCFGSMIQFLFPETSPGLYAIVCAGALLAGAFQVPLAGAIILFEICHNYDLILPLIFSSVIASFIVQKSGVKTFNPLQGGIVDDEEKVHPRLLAPQKE
jgi:chloride channel protein, CIC family